MANAARLRKTALATFYMYILFLIFHIQSLLKNIYIYSCNAKLRRQSDNTSSQQQKQLFTSSTFFCTFLCRCFTRLQRETSTNFLVTHFMEEMSYVFSLTFFSLPLIFTLHWWPLAFLIFSPQLQNCHVVLVTKKYLLCFFLSLQISVALFLVELRWHAAYFLFFSVFLLLYFPIFWE